MPFRLLAAGALLAAGMVLTPATSLLSGQVPGGCWTPSITASIDSVRIARARGRRVLRAARLGTGALVIDGRLDEAAWCTAEAAADFVQSRPAPGTLATLPSAVRVLFDDDAVYVGVRLEDPHPDSLVEPYPRRDDEVTSDWVFVELDTRFDRRSGFSFGLNPRGVQADGAWADDVNYNPAWNGVWRGAAQTDSLGWSAEFRIPFAEIALGRSTPGVALTWGINIYRTTPHRGETSNWSPRLPTVTGVVSHFNLLEGLVAPPRVPALQIVPYAAVTGIRQPTPADAWRSRMGADIRVRPSASSSILLSLNPDFGQVEADPSQVNLTTFETFLPEQRPLFVEGAEIFQFNSALAFESRGTSFVQESPFYSRRIGRAPQMGLPPGTRALEVPTATTVLGAGRYAARWGSWSGGLLHAWTDGEYASGADSAGRHRVQLEPLTNYSVARLLRESGDGTAALGGMATLTDRLQMSARADSQLPRRAVTLGGDGRWRNGGYELTGFLMGSRVDGSAAAITRLRHEPRHGYDRPAGATTSPQGDSTHRVLSGLAAQARVADLEGRFQWSLAGRLVSRGFEANDLGFQRNADWLLLMGDWQYQRFRPGHWLRRWSVGSSGTGLGWTTGGDPRARVLGLNLGGDLRSYWGGSLSVGREFPALDPEMLRGGPALLRPARDRWALALYSDTRRSTQFTLSLAAEREAGSGSRQFSLSPGYSTFVTDRLQFGIIPEVNWVREGWQFVARPADSLGRTRYLVGGLDQRTASLTTRATYAFSPHLTLQWYAQAFLSGGRYRGFGTVVAPTAASAKNRVAGIAPGRLERDAGAAVYRLDPGTDSSVAFADPAFSDRVLHINLVLRWEFQPGSTLFLVWTQEREDQAVGLFRLGRDLERLARAAPTDALQLKVSYWLSP